MLKKYKMHGGHIKLIKWFINIISILKNKKNIKKCSNSNSEKCNIQVEGDKGHLKLMILISII